MSKVLRITSGSLWISEYCMHSQGRGGVYVYVTPTPHAAVSSSQTISDAGFTVQFKFKENVEIMGHVFHSLCTAVFYCSLVQV